MLSLSVCNVPMEFVNEDLGNDSHGMREEVFPPVVHGKRSHVHMWWQYVLMEKKCTNKTEHKFIEYDL